MLLSLLLSGVVLAINHAPTITVQEGVEPEIVNYGELVELPIEINDVDGDPVTLFYRFDDDQEWEQLEVGEDANEVPGDIFSLLDPEEEHDLHLYVSDGTLDSEPVTLAKVKAKKKGKSKVVRKKKATKRKRKGKGKGKGKGKSTRKGKAPKTKPAKGEKTGKKGGAGGQPGAPEEPAPAPEQPAPAPEQPAPAPEQPAEPEKPAEPGTPAEPEKPAEGGEEKKEGEGGEEKKEGEGGEEGGGEEESIGIDVDVQSLNGDSVAISYSFDDTGVWSEPVTYPLGTFEIPIPASEFDKHSAPGDHRVTMKFEEQGDEVSHDVYEYSVNSPPSLQVNSPQALSFKTAPSGPVSLPFSVMDTDEDDELSLFYRFEGQGEWTHVPAGAGVNVLPAEAFAARGAHPGSGFIEVAAWDGYDHSEERLRIPYSIEEEDNGAFFGSLSPVAFAGIMVGSVAIFAVAIALIVIGRRRKAESSSTGLIESE